MGTNSPLVGATSRIHKMREVSATWLVADLFANLVADLIVAYHGSPSY